MNFLNRIEYIDWLLRTETAGNADSLAKKLHVSKRTVFNYLKWMRDKGAPIVYSKDSDTFLYQKEVVFVTAFLPPDIKKVIEYM